MELAAVGGSARKSGLMARVTYVHSIDQVAKMISESLELIDVISQNSDNIDDGEMIHVLNRTDESLILDFYGFRPFDGPAEAILAQEIARMTQGILKSRLIFGCCLDFLVQNRLLVPNAGRLTKLIRRQLNVRKRVLIRMIKTNLSPAARCMLDELFTQEPGGDRYRLTLLKKLSQSTKPSKIKESVADFRTIAEIHGQLAPVLDVLDLGTDGIRYYAGSVLKAEMFQLHRRAAADRYLHAIAFIAHQHTGCRTPLSTWC